MTRHVPSLHRPSLHRVPRSLGVVVLALSAGAAAVAFTTPASASGDDPAAQSISAGQRPAIIVSGKKATKGNDGTLPNISPESVIGADGRKKVADTTTYPARAIGQIEFGQDGAQYICTGWLIDKNSILTSGHCSFTPDGVTGNVIDYASFAPGRNRLVDPYSSCPVYEVFAPLAWRRDGSVKNDWSVMQLGTNNAGTVTTCDVGTTVGWFGISWTAGDNALTGDSATVQGYPGDKAFGTQWTMSGTIFKSTKQMVYYKMDTAGGQSGSPIFDPTGANCGGSPCGMAVHSYGVGLAGPGANANAGPRITQTSFTTITNYAAGNG
jgi:glutamyl endopeptidase